jgi:hypothetical protein
MTELMQIGQIASTSILIGNQDWNRAGSQLPQDRFLLCKLVRLKWEELIDDVDSPE